MTGDSNIMVLPSKSSVNNQNNMKELVVEKKKLNKKQKKRLQNYLVMII